MRVYQITKSRKRARGSSSESTEFQDQLVEPLSARSYRMFLSRISQVPDLNGRQNKFSGDTGLSRSLWQSPTTDAHRAARILT